MAKKDECCIVIKAQPHRSSKYFETVCCAGIGRDGKWRRQYPVPFRVLKADQKFMRWDWIEYEFVVPEIDRRHESQKVDPGSIVVKKKMSPAERKRLINPLIRGSFAEADARGDSLALIRPKSISIRWRRKTATQIASEREKHAALSRQLSLLDAETDDFETCPYSFRLIWTDRDGGRHDHEMDDWETIGAFARFEALYGEVKALEVIKKKYEAERFDRGLVLAFSTHQRRNVTLGTDNQWLLVGLLSVSDDPQTDLFMS